MALLKVDDGSPALDPDAVVEEVRRVFPQAVLHPGDQLAEAADRALALADAASPEIRKRLLKVATKLRRDAGQYGPAYALSVPQPGAGPIRVVVRPRDVVFLSEAKPPPAAWEQVLQLLGSFKPGRIHTTDDTIQFTRPFP